MTADPVRNLLDRLKGVKPAGLDKWEAYCPLHESPPDGHKRSLSIKQTHDNRALVYCHGCGKEKTATILAKVGLTMADLAPPTMPGRAGRPKVPAGAPKPKAAKPAKVYALPCLAGQQIARQTKGTFAGWWPYFRADGGEALIALRFDLPGDKTYRPIYPKGGGWSIGDPPGPLPLYRLADLGGAVRMYVVEGEKCADAAAGIGLIATTSAHGANAADKTDWTPLAGYIVIILSDNDTAGRQYAADVAAILTRLDPPATVRIVKLPGLPEGGDIVNYIEAHDAQNPEDIRREIDALADAAPEVAAAETPSAASDGPAAVPILVCMADVKPEPLRWLWPNRIPLGKVTLVFGDPGLGKSFLTLDIAARVSRGIPWPDAAANGERAAVGGVILLSAEDDPADTIRPRLDTAGAEVGRIKLLKGVEYATGHKFFNLAGDLPALIAAIEQTPDPRLVIIDPISAYLGGTDSHKNADIRGLLAPLADMAARYGVAVVAVTHLNKGAGGRALYRATGSLAFVAAARAGWLVIADAENADRCMFLSAKSNLAKKPTGLAYTLGSVEVPGIGPIGRIAWEPEAIMMTADDALAAAAADPEERTARESAAEWLRDALAGGPMLANDVKAAAKESSVAWRTVRRAMKAAGVTARRQGFGPGAKWYWFLPGQTTAPPAAKDQSIIEGQHTPLDTYEKNGKPEGEA